MTLLSKAWNVITNIAYTLDKFYSRANKFIAPWILRLNPWLRNLLSVMFWFLFTFALIVIFNNYIIFPPLLLLMNFGYIGHRIVSATISAVIYANIAFIVLGIPYALRNLKLTIKDFLKQEALDKSQKRLDELKNLAKTSLATMQERLANARELLVLYSEINEHFKDLFDPKKDPYIVHLSDEIQELVLTSLDYAKYRCAISGLLLQKPYFFTSISGHRIYVEEHVIDYYLSLTETSLQDLSTADFIIQGGLDTGAEGLVSELKAKVLGIPQYPKPQPYVPVYQMLLNGLERFFFHKPKPTQEDESDLNVSPQSPLSSASSCGASTYKP